MNAQAQYVVAVPDVLTRDEAVQRGHALYVDVLQGEGSAQQRRIKLGNFLADVIEGKLGVPGVAKRGGRMALYSDMGIPQRTAHDYMREAGRISGRSANTRPPKGPVSAKHAANAHAAVARSQPAACEASDDAPTPWAGQPRPATATPIRTRAAGNKTGREGFAKRTIGAVTDCYCALEKCSKSALQDMTIENAQHLQTAMGLLQGKISWMISLHYKQARGNEK